VILRGTFLAIGGFSAFVSFWAAVASLINFDGLGIGGVRLQDGVTSAKLVVIAVVGAFVAGAAFAATWLW
jgi:hypothetical protein